MDKTNKLDVFFKEDAPDDEKTLDSFLLDDEPQSTHHILSNLKNNLTIPINSYTLSVCTKNGHHYSLVQINSSGANLVYPYNNTTETCKLTANKTRLIVVVTPEGEKEYVPQLINLEDLDFEQISKLCDHDISVGKSNIVASYKYFSSEVNGTVKRYHSIIRFNLDTGKVDKKWIVSGMLNVRLVHDSNDNFYIAGDGSNIEIDGKSIKTFTNMDYFVAKVDTDGCLTWTATTPSKGISLSNFKSTVNVNGASLNIDTEGEHKDNLLVTGSFVNSITLDKEYKNSSGLESMWWGEINTDGCWVRSGVLGPPSNKINTLSILGGFPYHVRGYDIFGWGKDVHIVGTYRGSICSELNSDKTLVFHNQVGFSPISVDANISDQTYNHTPSINMIKGSLLISTYFDTLFKLGNIQYRNKGTHGLVIFPAPINNKTNNKIVKYISLGGNFNPNHSMISGCSEIFTSSNITLSNSINYAHFSTYKM